MQIIQSRRDFLASASLVAAAGALGARPLHAAEGPPETTTIRLPQDPSVCVVPAYVADDLLRAEGFSEIHYMPTVAGIAVGGMAARGEIDFGVIFAPSIVRHIDTGERITAIAGVHTGCYELFANERIQTIVDLKGKRVAVPALRSSPHLYLSVLAKHIGLDPRRDIQWVTGPAPLELFAAGEVDAFLGFPPEPQELRARGIDRVILNTGTERPWSQYYCCMLLGNRDYVRNYPVATKRVLRAILKSIDYCAAEPSRAAQQLIDGGFADRLDYAQQTLSEVPFSAWRDYDPEDSMRFYALRLHEVGMIKSGPNRIIAEGADWRFLNELKRELKA